MERDALIAHGTSYLLQDRLMNCSDYSTAWVCRACGSLISLGYQDISTGENITGSQSFQQSGPNGEYCRLCRPTKEEQARRDRVALDDNSLPRLSADVKISMSSQHVLGHASKDGDLDVVAVPFVFRYLCAELASMGIAVSLEVK
jgi:DNA-directed RNA polymerase I subunit RPA2